MAVCETFRVEALNGQASRLGVCRPLRTDTRKKIMKKALTLDYGPDCTFEPARLFEEGQ